LKLTQKTKKVIISLRDIFPKKTYNWSSWFYDCLWWYFYCFWIIHLVYHLTRHILWIE